MTELPPEQVWARVLPDAKTPAGKTYADYGLEPEAIHAVTGYRDTKYGVVAKLDVAGTMVEVPTFLLGLGVAPNSEGFG